MIPLTLIDPDAPTPAMIRKGKIADKARARAQARRDDNRAFGELLYFKFKVIKARMQAHGMEIDNYLGPTLLALSPAERWLGQPNERAVLEHYARTVPAPYIAACEANPTCEVKDFRVNPLVVLRFEHASVIGTIGDGMSASANKSWGPALSVDPIPADMDVSGNRILFMYHASSKYNQRIEQRKAMKRKLGKHRALVGAAMADTKTQFLKTATGAQAQVIRDTFNVDLGQFWRAVKGREYLEDRPAIERGELF